MRGNWGREWWRNWLDCWKDLKGRAKDGKVVGEWESERREYYREKRWEIEEIEEREKGKLRGEDLMRREKK